MAKGRIVVDLERCKGCELCRQACPKDVLALAETFNAKGYRPIILLDPLHNCTGCALCATVCPEGCITVYRELPSRASPRKAMASGSGDQAQNAQIVAEAAPHG